MLLFQISWPDLTTNSILVSFTDLWFMVFLAVFLFDSIFLIHPRNESYLERQLFYISIYTRVSHGSILGHTLQLIVISDLPGGIIYRFGISVGVTTIYSCLNRLEKNILAGNIKIIARRLITTSTLPPTQHHRLSDRQTISIKVIC